LGFGLNTWNLVLPRNAYSHMFNFDFISPGNEVFYGSRVLETGLLGLITTLVVFATVLRTIYKAYRTAPEPTRGIMAALFAINASLVVAGLGESPLLFTPIAVLFWTFAGLATAVREQPLMRFLNSKRTLKNSK
jgi:O-antigen ligase